MKFALLFLCTCIFPFTHLRGQDQPARKTKKELKTQAKTEKNERLKSVYGLIQSKNWIFSMENVQTLSELQIPISPNSNFIICETDIATLQLPIQELIETGESTFSPILGNADVISYSVEPFKDHSAVKFQIQLQCEEIPWIKMKFEVNSEGVSSVYYLQSDGVNFTVSGQIKTFDE